MSFVKKLALNILGSRATFHAVYFIAITLGYRRDIFNSKYFRNDFTGVVWVLKSIWFQRILGFNRFSKNLIHHTTKINNERNLSLDVDSIDALMSPGCYFQCMDAHIRIEKNVLIAPNVGLITSNHDIYNPELHIQGKDIIIREGCWIGMNSVVLPGVELGKNTVVAAGSVVTKSFPQGRVLLAGSPAVIKKHLTNT